MTTQPIIGIDLGGTNMQIGLVNENNEVVAQVKRKTKAAEGLDAVLDRLTEGVTMCCAEAGCDVSSLQALGIGAPGAVDNQAGVVLEAVNLRWTKVPLRDLLHQRLGTPVHVENDVNIAVYGENELGAGKQSKHLMGVWIGTGVGGGFILDGKLYHGHYRTAGELGHTLVFPMGPPGGRSLEEFSSRTSIVDRLVRLIKANEPSCILDLVNGDLSKLKSKTVARAYESGDALTRSVVDWATDLTGRAIASAVTLLSLERVVLGGGLTEELEGPILETIGKAVREDAFPDVCQNVEIVASTLQDRAGIVGAAMLARQYARPGAAPTSEMRKENPATDGQSEAG